MDAASTTASWTKVLSIVALASSTSVAALTGTASCGQSSFVCQANEQCGSGQCELTGFCSFADVLCKSGRRYGDLAGDDLAGTCVGVDTETDSPPTTSDDAGPPDSSGGPGDTLAGLDDTSDGSDTDAPTTSATDPTTDTQTDSDTGVGARCGDGVVSGDEACDAGQATRACNAWCQVPGTVLWADDYDETDDERSFDISVADDGSFVIVGFIDVQPRAVLVRRYFADGDVAWTLAENESNGAAEARAVDHDPSGDLMLAGHLGNPDPYPWLAKVSADGQLQWQHTDSDVGQFWGITVDDEGTVYGVGEHPANGFAAGTDAFARAFANNGGIALWTRLTGGNGNQVAYDAVIVQDRLTVAGATQPVLGNDAGLFYELDAATGAEIGQLTIGSPGDGRTLLNALEPVDSSFIVVGTADTAGAGWQHWYGYVDLSEPTPALLTAGGSGNDELFGLTVDEQGNAYVCGFVNVEQSGEDIWVQKFAPGGESLWTHEFSGDGNGRDRCFAVALGPEGTLLATGYQADSDTNTDVWVRRFAR